MKNLIQGNYHQGNENIGKLEEYNGQAMHILQCVIQKLEI